MADSLPAPWFSGFPHVNSRTWGGHMCLALSVDGGASQPRALGNAAARDAKKEAGLVNMLASDQHVQISQASLTPVVETESNFLA